MWNNGILHWFLYGKKKNDVMSPIAEGSSDMLSQNYVLTEYHNFFIFLEPFSATFQNTSPYHESQNTFLYRQSYSKQHSEILLVQGMGTKNWWGWGMDRGWTRTSSTLLRSLMLFIMLNSSVINVSVSSCATQNNDVTHCLRLQLHVESKLLYNLTQNDTNRAFWNTSLNLQSNSQQHSGKRPITIKVKILSLINKVIPSNIQKYIYTHRGFAILSWGAGSES